MKKNILALFLIVGPTIGFISNVHALPTYLSQYNAKYGTTATCTLCHTTPPTLNSTGTAFLNSGHSLAAIAPAAAPVNTTPPPPAVPPKTVPPPSTTVIAPPPAQSPSAPAPKNAGTSTPNKATAKTPKKTVGSVPITNSTTNTVNMGVWAGKWFKMNMKNKGYYTEGSGLSNDRETIVRYLRIQSWDPANKVLQAALYEQDPQTGRWASQSLPLHYIAGNPLNFRFQSQVTGDSEYAFSGRIRGTEVGGVLENARLKTLGGYHLQINDEPSSEEHWAGWLTITGKMIQEEDVPVPADVVLNSGDNLISQ